jgi:hypothetical protein
MDKAMSNPINFNVEVRTFPKPGSIRILTLQHAQALHEFRLQAGLAASARGRQNLLRENRKLLRVYNNSPHIPPWASQGNSANAGKNQKKTLHALPQYEVTCLLSVPL